MKHIDAPENSQRHNVFVYGTLRSTERNNWLMEEIGATFLGKTSIQGKCQQTRFGVPVFTPGTNEVPGEIYAVDDKGLARLDRFESHPDFYRRTEVTAANGLVVNVYEGVSPSLLEAVLP